jgi:hypothetical protein
MRDIRTLSFRILTVLFAGFMLLSAGLYLSGATVIREGMALLGYPAYITIILGTAKLLGAAALVQPRVPLLREWAYAGFTINLIGAAASHVLAGDAAGAGSPLLFLALLAVSYALKPSAVPATSSVRAAAWTVAPQRQG